MRLFILAAGKGTRLLPLTKDMPKVLLDLGGGKTLLNTQIKNAIATDIITDIVIISGYFTKKIRANIAQFESLIPICVVHNPFFNHSNNLMSLWVVQHLMRDKDFLITNGDNMYNQGIYNKVISQTRKEGIYVTIDHKENYDEDDMKVSFSGDKITKIHKEIAIADTQAESVGLCVVKGEKSRLDFANQLLTLAEDENYINKYWLEIFNALIDCGTELHICTIATYVWKEVDFHPDMAAMKKFILGQL